MTLNDKIATIPEPCRDCSALSVTFDYQTSKCNRCSRLPDKAALHDIERNKGACRTCPEKAHYPDCDPAQPCPYVVR